MSEIELHSKQTPEEVLEAEIEELEKWTLNSAWLWAVAAIGLVVLFGSAFLVANWDRNQANARPITISPEAMTLKEPIGVVDRTFTFRWNRVDRAASYIILAKAADRDEVELLRPVRESFLRPSEVEAANFNPGSYNWTVEARSATGQLIGYGEGSFSVPAGQ